MEKAHDSRTNLNKPWINIYKPKASKDIVGQDSAVKEISNFISNFKRQKRKAMIIYGPPGCGKTAAVYAVANDLNYEVLEVNASDFRNADSINSIVGSASKQRSLFAIGKVILVDEIDGLSGQQDRGGIQALAKLLEETSYPIICTSFDPFEKKFSDLRKKSELVEFKMLDYATIFEFLRKICEKEKVKFNELDLKALSRRVGGDLRAAINDLQLLAGSSKELKKEDIDDLSQRNKEESIKDALVKVFKTTDAKVAINAFENVDEDPEHIMLWVDENLPLEYTKPEDLARAYEYISKADVFNRRIRRWQHWRFLVYIQAFLSLGVAVSKDEKYKHVVNYQQTQRLLKYYIANMKYAKRKAIAEKIAEKTHCSTKRALQDHYPYIKYMFKRNKTLGEELTEEFGFDNEEVAWLRA